MQSEYNPNQCPCGALECSKKSIVHFDANLVTSQFQATNKSTHEIGAKNGYQNDHKQFDAASTAIGDIPNFSQWAHEDDKTDLNKKLKHVRIPRSKLQVPGFI